MVKIDDPYPHHVKPRPTPLRRARARRLVAVTTALLLAPAALVHAESWTSLDGGQTRNAVSTTFPSTDLSTAWTGTPASGSIGDQSWTRSCVLVDDERVYAVHRDVEEPSLGRLVALERSTGSLVWESTVFAHAPVDCPVIAGGLVVAATGFSPLLNERPGLRAFDAATGTVSWNQPFTAGQVSSALASDGTRVYASGYFDDCPTFDVHAAWDLTTGARAWCVPGSQTEAAPVVVDGAVVVGRRSEPGLTALSATDGTLLWDDPEAIGPFSVAGEGVEVAYGVLNGGGSYGVRVRAAATGGLTWNSAPTSNAAGAVVLDEDRVYASFSLMNGGNLRLRSYDRATGASAWPATVNGEPVQRENLFLLGDTVAAGSVFADRATGVSGPGYPWGELPKRPAFTDGTIFGWLQNADSTWSVAAVRDTTAPVLGALAPAAGSLTTDATPQFTFAAADGEGRGVTSLTLTLDQTAYDVTGSTAWTPPTDLADGQHTWTVTATDANDNTTTSPARSLVVDSTPPAPFAVTSPTGQVTTGLPPITWDAATDATSGIDHYDVRIDGSRVTTVEPCATPCSVELGAPLADGAHTVEVIAVDLAGSSRSSGIVGFTVAAAPVAVLSASSLMVLAGDSVLFDASRSTDNDRVATYEWSIDGAPFQTGNDTRVISFPTVAQHSVAVRVSDPHGRTDVAEQVIDVRAVPPEGEVGVSINRGAYATNDPAVEVSVVWRKFDTEVLLSNDGGFGPEGGTQTLPLAPRLDWTLLSEGSERLPKTVYARLRGRPGAENRDLTDDIVLDTTAPVIDGAELVIPARLIARALAARTVKVRFTASDKAAGVRAVQVTSDRSRPGRQITFTRSRKVSKTVRAAVSGSRVYIRAIDAAGNPSGWRRAR